MLNCVSLVGNLGADPELRNSQNGTAWTSLRMAVNEFYNGEQKTHWFSLTAFGKNAEIICQYCQKGSKIGIVGKLTTREWEDSNSGQKRTNVEIKVDQVELLNTQGQGQNQQNGNYQGNGQQNRNQGQQNRGNQNQNRGNQRQQNNAPPPPDDFPPANGDIPF